MFGVQESVYLGRQISLQYGMQILFYILVSGNDAESSLATMQYLPQNIRFAKGECYTNHYGPNKEG